METFLKVLFWIVAIALIVFGAFEVFSFVWSLDPRDNNVLSDTRFLLSVIATTPFVIAGLIAVGFIWEEHISWR